MLGLKYPLILASNSPRRQELLSQMGFEFRIKTVHVDETYPENLPVIEIPIFLALKKAKTLAENCKDNILLSADTIVAMNDRILGKPSSEAEAKDMLTSLSGSIHSVYTGVCIYVDKSFHTLIDKSDVTFSNLSNNEIDYYLQHYTPLDKAGAYGIQEWIGLIGIKKVHGSYFNVVGLPTEKVYSKFKDLKLIVN